MYGNKLEPPKRKVNRMRGYDYSLNGAYFITICAKDRAELFWEQVVGADIIRPYIGTDNFSLKLSEYGKIVETAINNIAVIYPNVIVDKFCIMPNHIHMIIFICNEYNGRIISAPTISTIVGQMKRWVSKEVGFPVWQKSFHDHIIRNKYDYKKITEYIEINPIKWESDCYYADNNKI